MVENFVFFFTFFETFCLLFMFLRDHLTLCTTSCFLSCAFTTGFLPPSTLTSPPSSTHQIRANETSHDQPHQQFLAGGELDHVCVRLGACACLIKREPSPTSISLCRASRFFLFWFTWFEACSEHIFWWVVALHKWTKNIARHQTHRRDQTSNTCWTWNLGYLLVKCVCVCENGNRKKW